MFCKNCGNEIRVGVAFCGKCGCRVASEGGQGPMLGQDAAPKEARPRHLLGSEILGYIIGGSVVLGGVITGIEDGEDMLSFLFGVILCVISGCLRIRQEWPRIVYTITIGIWMISLLSALFDDETTFDTVLLLVLFAGCAISGLALAWQSVVGKWIAK